MELNCPNCTTHFTVPDDAIGPKGRKLKCAMCGHTWKQMPLGYVPEENTPAPEPKRAAPTPPPPPAVEPEPDFEPEPDPVPAPLSFEDALADARNALADARNAEPDSEPMPMEMPPVGRVRPDPLDGYADDDLPMDSDGRSRSASDDDDPLAGLDFGSPFDDNDDDSFGRSAGPRSDLGRAPLDSDLEDLLAAEPEPIPELFGRSSIDDDDESSDGSKKNGAMLFLVFLIVMMTALGAGTWFGRSAIITSFPRAESLYDMLGITVDAPGSGLQFKDVTSEWLSRNGVDTLVVRGFIANISSSPKAIPSLSLILFGPTDEPVQRAIIEPPQPNLESGMTTAFRVQLGTPDARARRFEMDWAKPGSDDKK